MRPSHSERLFSSHEYSMQLGVGDGERALVGPRLACSRPGRRWSRVGDVAGVGALERLHQVQLVAVWVALRVEPREAVEPDGVDDQRVAIPFRDRLTEPRRVRILGVLGS